MNEFIKVNKDFASNFIDFSNKNIDYRERMTNELLMALVEEAVEVRRCIHWKFWKKKERDPNLVQVKEELIDCFCFLLELFALWDMDEHEIRQIHTEKMKLNEKRFLESRK